MKYLFILLLSTCCFAINPASSWTWGEFRDSLKVDSLKSAPFVGTDAHGKFIPVTAPSTDSARAAHIADTCKHEKDTIRASFKADTASRAAYATQSDTSRASHFSDSSKNAHKSDTSIVSAYATRSDTARASHFADSSKVTHKADTSVKAHFSDSTTNSHKSDTAIKSQRAVFSDSSTNAHKADTVLSWVEWARIHGAPAIPAAYDSAGHAGIADTAKDAGKVGGKYADTLGAATQAVNAAVSALTAAEMPDSSGSTKFGNVKVDSVYSVKGIKVDGTIFGKTTGYANIGDHSNVSNGYIALGSLTSGIYNTADGYMSLSYVTSGSCNTGLGYSSGNLLDTGCYNIAIGVYSGQRFTAGDRNIDVGNVAGWNSTGSNNLCIGNGAGISTYGDYKLYIDNRRDLSSLNINPLIFGDFSARKVAIDTINPDSSFMIKSGHVTGGLRVDGPLKATADSVARISPFSRSGKHVLVDNGSGIPTLLDGVLTVGDTASNSTNGYGSIFARNTGVGNALLVSGKARFLSPVILDNTIGIDTTFPCSTYNGATLLGTADAKFIKIGNLCVFSTVAAMYGTVDGVNDVTIHVPGLVKSSASYEVATGAIISNSTAISGVIETHTFTIYGNGNQTLTSGTSGLYHPISIMYHK